MEAEEYDLGGQNIAYNDGTPANLGGAFRTAEGVDVRTCPDAGGGYAIGWTTDGEWMKYSVNVTTSGVYDFAVRAGTPNSGKSVQLQVDDVTVGTLTIVNTGGFNNWQTSTLSNISLTAGDHTFRFLLNTGNVSNPDFGFDINWFSFTIAATPSPTANAGGVQTITLPTTQVTLAGSGTANNGGSIINHTWE
ncbi:MAG: carbohydrate-binding protein [Chitinophagaceae bacterium]